MMEILQRFFAPLLRIGTWLIYALPVWVGLLIVLYLCSNIQIVSADERALVFRFGALRNAGTPQAEQGPGLLFAFPEPIDRVARFSAQKVYSLEIIDLHLPQNPTGGVFSNKTLDPEQVGYVLSADRNLIHVRLAVRYQLSSAEEFYVQQSDPEEGMRSIILASTVMQSGLRTIDDILTNGRDSWVSDIQKTAQDRMSQQRLGVSIVSLEVLDLQVPSAVRSDFQSVQSAVVDAQTQEQEAKAYHAEKIPKARAWSSNEINTAKSESLAQVARARAESSAFLALITDDPKLLKTRIYRERLKTIFSDIGSVRFVPPPSKAGMRITIREGR
jgi:membrane protease subunit HflK